ncbi:putative transposase [Neobacillus drentensis]|nr:putative transposase [Neobacillus drentensis]
MFEDESLIRDYQAIASTWFPKGQQKIIPTYGKHHGAKLLATVDYESGEIYWEEHEKYDAQVFLTFLENIVVKYPKGKTVMVLDKARIHHAKLIQPFLQEYSDQLELVFLPPYSPQLNIVEGLWGWLKKSVIYNVFFSCVEEIRTTVQSFMDEISNDPMKIVDRLCVRI